MGVGESVDKLDIHIFTDEIKFVSLGKMPKQVVDFIISKKPEFKDRLLVDNEILFWAGRVKHSERHRADFASDDEFYQCMQDIPFIIQNPDYISIHPKDQSVSFIKDYSGHTSVAIKVASNGVMSYRTIYPLTNDQLEDYIKKGRAWKFGEDT